MSSVIYSEAPGSGSVPLPALFLTTLPPSINFSEQHLSGSCSLDAPPGPLHTQNRLMFGQCPCAQSQPSLIVGPTVEWGTERPVTCPRAQSRQVAEPGMEPQVVSAPSLLPACYGLPSLLPPPRLPPVSPSLSVCLSISLHLSHLWGQQLCSLPGSSLEAPPAPRGCRSWLCPRREGLGNPGRLRGVINYASFV